MFARKSAKWRIGRAEQQQMTHAHRPDRPITTKRAGVTQADLPMRLHVWFITSQALGNTVSIPDEEQLFHYPNINDYLFT
jgi:hypothetical protein